MDGLGPIDIEILIDNPALVRTLIQAERDVQRTDRQIVQETNKTGEQITQDAKKTGDNIAQNAKKVSEQIAMNAKISGDRISQGAKQTEAQLDGWAKNAAVAAASFFSISAAKNFVAELINVHGEFQQINVAYETILKSKAKGDALFADTIKFAATTPFNLTEVAQGTKQLLAYGFQANQINSTLTTLGNVAAGVSAPLGDIIYLYGTLRTQGRAYAQDIRQFTGRGIPIIQELAKQFGVTEEQVNKLVEAGKVGFPQVQKAFESLTGSSGIFYNLMEKQSKTLTGQLSNLEDSFSQMLNEIGAANEGILNDGIALASSIVNNYQQVLDIIELLIIAYGSYKAAVIISSAATVAASTANAAAIALESAAYHILRDGIAVLNAEKLLAVTSTAAYTAVIAGIVAALKSWHDASALQNSIIEETTKITGDAAGKVEVEKAKIGELTKIINNHNNTQEERIAALKKLNSLSPEYLGNITLETSGTRQATQAIKDYLAQLEQKLVGEAAYSQKLENLRKIAELKTKGVDAISSFQRVGYSLKNFFSGDITTGTKEDNDLIVKNLIASYESANKQIDSQFGEAIKKTLTGGGTTAIKGSKFSTDLKNALDADGVKKIISDFNVILKEANSETDLEALRDGIAAKLKALAPNDAQKDILKKRLTEVKNLIKTYDPGEDAKQQKAVNAELDARNAIADKVAKINEESRQNSLTADQKEVAQTKQKYEQLLKAIDDYNIKAERNKWKKIDPTKVNINGVVTNIPKAEQAAVDDVVAKQQVEKQRAVIDQQKEIFDAFEQYKLQHGEAAATELYAGQLQGFKTYIEYLKSLMPDNGDFSAKANAQRDLLSKLIITANKEDQKAQMDNFAQLLSSTLTYEQQRVAIIDKYIKQAADLRAKAGQTANAETKKAYLLQADQAIKNGEAEVDQLDESNLKQIEAYKHLFDEYQKMRDADLRDYITKGKAKADLDLKSGLLSKKGYDQLQVLFKTTKQTLDDKLYDNLNVLAKNFNTIAGSLQNVNGALSAILGSVGNAISNVANVGKLKSAFDNAKTSQDKFAAGSDLVAAGISSVTNLVGVFTSASQKRKEAEEAYQRDVLNFQNQYKLNTIEQIRLNEQLNQNLFFKNYQKDIASAASALAEGDKAFKKSLVDLQGGVAKDGKRNATDGDSILKAGAAGAAIGGIAGSVVPVIGNAVGVVGGALIGGVAGAIGGLFGGKKKVDNLVPLLGKYPELITKAKDGTDQFNDALAKNLIQNNLVTDSTKVLLQNTIDLNDARKAAIDQINQDIKDLAGGLGTDLQNALVTAFENGTDAFTAFKGTVEKGIQDIVAQFLFENIFGGEFDKLSDDLKASFGVTGDQNAVDDLTNFYKDAGPLVKQYQDALKAAQAEAKKNGLDLFQPDGSGAGSSSSLSGAIKGITADQATVLEGAIRGMQLTLVQVSGYVMTGIKNMADQLAELKNQTLLQMQIAANTKRTADNTDDMKSSLKSIDSNTSSTNLTNVLRAAGK